jgi:hypothetical protein
LTAAAAGAARYRSDLSRVRAPLPISSQTGFNTTTGICRSVLVWYSAYGP